MALFEFELARVEDIVPWEGQKGPYLSWFALTDGRFWMPVGDQVLFEYSDEIMAHWTMSVRHADYQVAAFAREVLGSLAAAVARLPERIERLASNWSVLRALEQEPNPANDSDEDDDTAYTAWRWLGERSPFSGYLVANPRFQFVRVSGELRIHWNMRDRVVDGHRVWTAKEGTHAMPVDLFVSECRDFANRLLAAMDERIAGLEAGTLKAQVGVNASSLREQHETWRAEFASYFLREYEPDIAWHEAESALQVIAKKRRSVF
jgi:hypothetical protein